VLIALRMSYLFLVSTAASLAFTSITAGCQATTPATTTASPAIQLTPYTASDQSASAGVPSGWQVTMGQQTVIQMTGPQGETVVLGNTVVAKNAAFQPGQRPGNGIDISMPYAATLPQKIAMILQQGTTISGKPFSQFTIASATPLQLPPTLGQCGRFVGGFTGQQGPMKLMAVFCSLPLDAGGTYKNIMLGAQAPAGVAAQSAPTAQAIFSSYRIPTPWLEKKLAPHTAAPPVSAGAGGAAAAAAMINRSTMQSEAGANVSANCFDLSVLRQTPTYQLPRSCGGTKPD
jgi:hypothetical protein